MHKGNWWDLPKIPYRPQYLELAYRLMETQPTEAIRYENMVRWVWTKSMPGSPTP